METILVENHDEQYESDENAPGSGKKSEKNEGELPTIKTIASPKQASASKNKGSRRFHYYSIQEPIRLYTSKLNLVNIRGDEEALKEAKA